MTERLEEAHVTFASSGKLVAHSTAEFVF